VPMRIWSPFGSATARAIPSHTPATIEVETPFEPVAVLIDPFYWPLNIELRPSAGGDRTAGANLVAQCVMAQGAGKLHELASLSLAGRGAVFGTQDRRLEVTELELTRGRELVVIGVTQQGEPGSVIDRGPELYLNALDLLASNDIQPDLLHTTGT